MRAVYEISDKVLKKTIGNFSIYSNVGIRLFSYSCVSGSTQTKYACPEGLYQIMWLEDRSDPKYEKAGKNPFASRVGGPAWYAYMEPQFKTARTELGIHPCHLGTAGCIGILFGMDDYHNNECRDIIKRGLKDDPKFMLNVIDVRK